MTKPQKSPKGERKPKTAAQPTGHMMVIMGSDDDGDQSGFPPGLAQMLGLARRRETAEKEVVPPEPIRVPPVGEILQYLDERVIKQREAKETLGVAVHKHYLRAAALQNAALKPDEDDGVVIEKSNVMMVGRTGTGKTLLAKSLAKMLDVPFIEVDASNLTEAGIIGENVDSIIPRLFMTADRDIEKTQRGIVFIDEIDKIASPKDFGEGGLPTLSSSRGRSIQRGLLKITEGTTVELSPVHKIDTSHILFVFSGAFEGLDEIIDLRLRSGKGGRTPRIGFLAASRAKVEADTLKNVQPSDLHKYGLMPELVGRAPVIAVTESLDEEDLVRMLTEPKNSIVKQFKKQFRLEGSELEFEPAAYRAIARKALAFGEGARGLRAVMESVLREPTIAASNGTNEVFVITEDFVEKKAPVIRTSKAALPAPL